MSIVKTIDVGRFRDEFRRMGRADQFSYAALGVLFEYLEEYSDGNGEPVELDAIALCCEWGEYESIEEAAAELGTDADDLRDRTTVLDVGVDGVLIEAY